MQTIAPSNCSECKAHVTKCLCGITCEDRGFDCEMEVQEITNQYHNPANADGYGEHTVKIEVCKHCGREREWEPEDPEPVDL